MVHAFQSAQNSFPYRLVIFDLDGTLAVPTGGKQWPADEADREPMPGRAEKLQALRDAGVILAIATNQGGVAYGIYSEAHLYNSIAHQVREWFGIAHENVEMCVYHPKGKIVRGDPEDRKPRPGMLLHLMDENEVSPDQTLFVGDDYTDEEAARNAGCTFTYADEFFSQDDDDDATRA